MGYTGMAFALTVRQGLGRRRAAAVAACCAAVALAAGAHAKPPAGGKAPPAERDRLYQRDQDRLAGAWSAFYAGKHPQVMRATEALLRSPFEAIRVEAAHCHARARWAAGDKTGARALWRRLAASTPAANVHRQAIARAVMLDADAERARLPAAVAGLEQETKGKPVGTCAAEAAIELARLYVKARRFDDAQRTLEFARDHLQETVKLEISEAVAAPFVHAAVDALKRLKDQRDAGRIEFEQAERLRRDEKFKDALAAYALVAKDFADTPYAPRSDLHVGHCLVGLGRLPQAAAHWQRFISLAPAGPWRGQAYLGIVLLYLQDLFNLAESAKHLQMARNVLAGALADADAGESWQAAAFDLHLHAGIVARLQGGAAGAAEAFDQARQAVPKPPSDLEGLIDAAGRGLPLIPKDAAAPGQADRATARLCMGVVYSLCDRPRDAERLFEGVAAGRGGGQTRPQAAFARFCRARLQKVRRNAVPDRAAYEESLRLYRQGSWQDETLCRIAAILDGEADEARAAAAKAAKTPADAELARRRHLQARAKALPYWQELIKRYPESPFLAPAMYHVGALEAEAGRWKDAAEKLAHFTARYGRSPWAGEACVWLIDTCLERLFDLPRARSFAEKALAWASEGAAKDRPASRAPPGARSYVFQSAVADACPPPDRSRRRRTLYAVYVRGGLLAYMARQYDRAVELFKAARTYEPPPDFVVVAGKIPTGIERMIDSARAQRVLTPPEAVQGDEKAALVLQLADAYYHGGDCEHGLRLASMVTSGQFGGAGKAQRSWGQYRLGRCLYGLKRPLEAKAAYMKGIELWPKAPWADRALFYAANTVHNHERDVEGAIRLWKKLVATCPESRLAPNAQMHVGVAYLWAGRHDAARKAFEEFLAAYGDSEYSDIVRNYYLKKAAEKASNGARQPVK